MKKDDIVWIKTQHGHTILNDENVHNVKTLLNNTGNGFCLAKFTQVTMHLGTGTTHSCHHPKPHPIPLEEIQNNPAALFNTKHLKEARKQMLNGEKPSECDYCWRIENNNGKSDRFFKSLEEWALPYHDKIQGTNPDSDFYPTYLEVDFSNVCNFNCAYCGPEYSTKWVEDLKQNGPLKVLDNTKYVQWTNGWQNLDDLAYKNSENNPYLDAFWKWFPEAYKHLHVFRITGGEPLLSKQTFKSMDWFIDNPNPNLEFNINSNLGVPDKLWDLFIEKLKILSQGNYVKKVTIFTSVDTYGKQAEYLRRGLDFELFKKRYEQLLELNNVRAVIMCTFNILSVINFKKLLEWVLILKRKYNSNSAAVSWETSTKLKLSSTGKSFTERKQLSPSHVGICGIDIPYLRHPSCLDAKIISKDLLQQHFVPAINFMAENTANHIWGSSQGFEDYELEKLKRIFMDIAHVPIDSHEIEIDRAKFYDFVNELDTRNSKNFLEVFPEMKEFYNLCKIANCKIKGGP
jgi:organic radical activating enzyme